MSGNFRESLARRVSARRLLLAAVLAIGLGIDLARVSGQAGRSGDLFAFFTLVSLPLFAVVMHRVRRLGFWFCLVFAGEWLLLPIVTAAVADRYRGDGFEGVAGAIGQGVLVAVTVPIGLLGFAAFLALALLRYRR